MVDGDNTYDLEAAPALIAAMREQTLDFVNGARMIHRPVPIAPVTGSAIGC